MKTQFKPIPIPRGLLSTDRSSLAQYITESENLSPVYELANIRIDGEWMLCSVLLKNTAADPPLYMIEEYETGRKRCLSLSDRRIQFLGKAE